MANRLRSTAFRGDPDLVELHEFFLPERQFAGDVKWTFGTSLKSAYVNSFEFMNHAPIVQLWRDEADVIQAVSRMSLGPHEWFFLAAPEFRDEDTATAILEQADAAFELLGDRPSWETVCHESDAAGIEFLERAAYVRHRIDEVFMERSLDGDPERGVDGERGVGVGRGVGDVESAVALERGVDVEQGVGEGQGVGFTLGRSDDDVTPIAGVDIRRLDDGSDHDVRERGLAQVDAFSTGEPTDLEVAWVGRTMPHQLRYGKPGTNLSVVAVDADGTIIAFADPFFDRTNLIGEFEPVGTRHAHQRRGLAQAVLSHGLNEMRNAGMTKAVVRTSFDNAAAIRAYESVGFVTTDRLLRFRKTTT